jgi:hypothetical protein
MQLQCAGKILDVASLNSGTTVGQMLISPGNNDEDWLLPLLLAGKPHSGGCNWPDGSESGLRNPGQSLSGGQSEFISTSRS